MSVRFFSKSSIKTGVKSADFWDGTAVVVTNSYESIATATGTGSSGTITFSAIPSTYKNLQIRVFAKDDPAGNGVIYLSFNSDSGGNYTRHRIVGTGSSVTAVGTTSNTNIPMLANAGLSSATSTYSLFVIDIVDYANTNKYKTVRVLSGQDSGTSGGVDYTSGSWSSVSAISTITLALGSGSYTTGTKIALYGIKG